jgi:hypothetical protein
VIKSRTMRGARNVARMGESIGAYRILLGKHGGRTRLGRLRRRWENNNKIDLGEV